MSSHEQARAAVRLSSLAHLLEDADEEHAPEHHQLERREAERACHTWQVASA